MNKETNFNIEDLEKIMKVDNLSYGIINVNRKHNKEHEEIFGIDSYNNLYNCTKEEIIKEINNIIKEYGDITQIDKFIIVDELICGRVCEVANEFKLDKVHCEIHLVESLLEDDPGHYNDYNILDIEVLKEILNYCNIHKQQYIEN